MSTYLRASDRSPFSKHARRLLQRELDAAETLFLLAAALGLDLFETGAELGVGGDDPLVGRVDARQSLDGIAVTSGGELALRLFDDCRSRAARRPGWRFPLRPWPV